MQPCPTQSTCVCARVTCVRCLRSHTSTRACSLVTEFIAHHGDNLPQPVQLHRPETIPQYEISIDVCEHTPPNECTHFPIDCLITAARSLDSIIGRYTMRKPMNEIRKFISAIVFTTLLARPNVRKLNTTKHNVCHSPLCMYAEDKCAILRKMVENSSKYRSLPHSSADGRILKSKPMTVADPAMRWCVRSALRPPRRHISIKSCIMYPQKIVA
jgi:hypothetical protein